MHTLYNSSSFIVVQFDVPVAGLVPLANEAATPELPAPAEPRATSPAAEAKAGGEAPAAESPSR